MNLRRAIPATSRETGSDGPSLGGNRVGRGPRALLLALGLAAVSLTAVVASHAGSSEVPTGITSHLPKCEKGDTETKLTSFEEPGAHVDIRIGSSDDKVITVTVIEGANVEIRPSEGMVDITDPEQAIAGITSRTYRIGDEIRQIQATAAPNAETKLVVSRPC